MRAVPIVLLALRFHLHLHHIHGPTIDYLGLALAAAASWIGVPGPGEPVLIAAAVFAARHSLDIGAVVFVAWVAATVGGVAGWLVGLNAGRAIVTAPGPLRKAREKAVARGDEIFRRHPVLAIVLTPSWVAGIHRVRATVFLLVNALGAALWALGIGLAAYWIGPTVVDAVSDLGWVTMIGLVALIIAGVTGEMRGRRRRPRGRTEATAPEH
jgi:membrane protein DedA with SNARE-associated domain